MEKLDLTKASRQYYTAKAKPTLVYIEKAKFLSLAGSGDPSQKEFADKVQALYSVAFTLKFICKARNMDFVVPKLEGQWWFDEQTYKSLSISEAPKVVKRADWKYTLLIQMPDFVTQQDTINAIKEVKDKKQLNYAGEIKLFTMKEGKAVQMLHVGPFDKEPETLNKLEEFMRSNKLEKNGLHHEIYLSDFRKTPPEKLKTILREPVR